MKTYRSIGRIATEHRFLESAIMSWLNHDATEQYITELVSEQAPGSICECWSDYIRQVTFTDEKIGKIYYHYIEMILEDEYNETHFINIDLDRAMIADIQDRYNLQLERWAAQQKKMSV